MKEKKRKTYIQYARPYKGKDDEPPILEVWSEGERPKKKLADFQTLYVYDDRTSDIGECVVENERLWDGIE